jgi:DNA-binding winged helix-turn-helix (wHTH) protein
MVSPMNPGLIPSQFRRNENSGQKSPAVPRFLRFGEFQLDAQRSELFKNGARVKLQGKVFDALVALLESPGDVVTREALRMRLWPLDAQVNYDANVNTTVNKLRQVLGDSSEQPAFVETIPRKGYSFVAKVEYADRLQEIEAGEQTSGVTLAVSGDALWPAAMASKWFRAGVVALVIASILLGAAITLFEQRAL